MNALEVQQVMAQLIRFPEMPLSEVQNSLRLRELSTEDQAQIEAMAQDPYVRKFGYKMRYCRQRDAVSVLRLSREHIAPADLTLLYRDYFEPSRTQSDFTMLGVQFLEFLLSDERCEPFLAKGPAFLKDLLRYDFAKGLVERQNIVYDDPSLPEKSLLRHRAFRMVDLAYDVPSLDRAKIQGVASKEAPKPKNLKLIFLRSELPPYYRMFEIDESVEKFLNAQLSAPEEWTGELPVPYPAMVTVGLCR